MGSESPRFVYKILHEAPAEPLPAQLPLSELDANDGFVHLSTAEQVPKTAGLFFTEHTKLWVIKLELSKLSDPVKFEDGYPHLYGNFGALEVDSTSRFEREQTQTWADSLGASSWLE
ncbi:hypothetical protein CCM_04999 [Cordyceps militaris CM01]|uniref:DUF952 domain protein n=1 Tax=Cordyceps militaris (strain CM01) TaxID=983644 RepID=G3JG06_CORMM|nr:uncharacterized protein CCM_04999 [Cordyceps militaris CM01]EGX93624.1 hypothetical protein CCM_04999 [Cordyceps militaris CM01]